MNYYCMMDDSPCPSPSLMERSAKDEADRASPSSIRSRAGSRASSRSSVVEAALDKLNEFMQHQEQRQEQMHSELIQRQDKMQSEVVTRLEQLEAVSPIRKLAVGQDANPSSDSLRLFPIRQSGLATRAMPW